MMTNKRQVIVHHVDSRRQDRRFYPYRRPTRYDRFTSVPQISALRQWLMTFIVVSRGEVVGTSEDPLYSLWFWPQVEMTSRILCRTSYCNTIRRNRRYHPYQSPGKYKSGSCKCCSLPFYLDCRYFSLSVRGYLDNTEANTATATGKEIESLAVDNYVPEEIESSTENNPVPDAHLMHDVQITVNKILEMITTELDKPTSDDIVSDSTTDSDVKLYAEFDPQQMRKTECETRVADPGSTVESKTNADLIITSFDLKQVNNVTSEDQCATTNLSTNETTELQQISQQNKALIRDTETAVIKEIDATQYMNDKIETGDKKRDTEDVCCKMSPTNEEFLDCGQSFHVHVSTVGHRGKTNEEKCNKRSLENKATIELHQASDTKAIVPPKLYKKRMSAAMFFQKEITNQSKNSHTPTCSDCNTVSFSNSQVTVLNSNKTGKPHSQHVSNTNQDLHSNNSLCVWLRKSSSSSEPYKASKNLSDQERLKMRKRRFGITAQNEEESTRNSRTDGPSNVPHATTKRRKIRLNRY